MIIRVDEFIDHPDREIEGVLVGVQEMIWTDGKRTWEIYHKASRRSLTGPNFELEEEPTYEQIFNRLKELVGFWICQGCGKSYRNNEESENEIYRHTHECDLWHFQIMMKRAQR